MGALTEKEINDAIKMKSNAILRKVGSKAEEKDLKKLVAEMYASKTFACLQKKETLFYLKPVAEFLYLLEKEQEGDMVAWEKQAF